MTYRFKTARCILYRENRFLLAMHNRFWPDTRRWGLPGGQVEHGEAPQAAAARELEEELQLYLSDLTEVGAYSYKRAMHMVYAASIDHDIQAFDEGELLDVGWFTEGEVSDFQGRGILHAGYELDAIQRLQAQLLGQPLAAAG